MARHEAWSVHAGRIVGLGADQQDAARSPCALLDQSYRCRSACASHSDDLRGWTRNQTIEIPRTIISVKSPNAAIRALTQHNVYVVRNDFARAEIINFLNWRPTKCKIIRTKTTGWLKTDNGYCFVLPLVPPALAPIMPKANGALATKRSRVKAQPEIIARLDTSIGHAGRNYGFHASGTVEEWQDRITRPLEGCSNVALAIGVGFAAPFVFFAGEQSGGVHSGATVRRASRRRVLPASPFMGGLRRHTATSNHSAQSGPARPMSASRD